jgi:hypothetical protein
MYKKLSTTIRRIRNSGKGDYLVVMKKNLSWKYYQDSLAISKRGI